MPDVEERLRDALTTLAGEVPKSPAARAELDRRLNTRHRGPRTMLLAAAAAVVVLGAVFVPIALSGDDPVHTPPAATPTTSPSTSTGSGFSPATASPVMEIAGAGMGPDAWSLHLFEEVDTGRFCFVVLVGHEWDGEPLCFAPPTFTGTGMVQTRSLVEMTESMDLPPVLRAELETRLLFFARPEVAALTVRSGDGREHASVTSLVRAGDPLSIFLATFVGTYEGFAYTAKDRDGTVVEQAIT
jgi:hypothetical protein